MLSDQIDEISNNMDKPDTSPYPIIYRALLGPVKPRDAYVPSRASLLEEAVALVIEGTDTTGATLTIGTYQILRNPKVYAKIKAEILEAWPKLDQRPKASELEKLPYLV